MYSPSVENFFGISYHKAKYYKLDVTSWEEAYKFFNTNGLDTRYWCQDWENATTSQDIYGREYIFSMIKIPRVKNLYLFGGIHKHDVAIREQVHHEITPCVQYPDLVGNIMIYAPTDRIDNRPESDYNLDRWLGYMSVIE